ncbi:MAG: Stk1 family PASTA domain-containing Ser/Thr kinase [Actinomycetes bacterium]
MSELTPGTEVANRYRIVRPLGSGGMGDVYLAEDRQLGRNVALKVLHRRFAGDPQFVERFRREAQAAAGLTHPNIVSIYDRGEADGTTYISMEYLDGRTLKDLILAEAPLDPLRAAGIAKQIMEAASFAHAGGVIHRDLKPQNVMVDAADRVKVTDFGIARAGASGITEVGSIMGSAHYVSPEQAEGREVGPASDIYSVGVVLYEMLTGQLPFDAESPVAIAVKQISQEPQPPSALQPGIPADLEALDLWALRKSEADRPADAAAFIAGLDAVVLRLQDGAATSATVAFAIPTAGAVAAGTAAAAAAATGTVPPDGEPPVDPAAARRKRWWIAAAVAGVSLLIVGGLFAFTDVFSPKQPQVTMPLVVGKKLQLATTSIANAGFKQSPSIQRVQSDKPRDVVIGQNPLAYAKVGDGTSVTLVVSDGPGTTQIPSVDGLKQAEAEALLKKAGFKVVIRMKADPTIPAGTAIATDPVGGISVDAGSQVTLIVSNGVEKVSVPNVVGSPIDDARSQLQAAGFVVVTTKQPSTTAPEGEVLGQTPSGGESVAKGSTVSLVVAAAPATVAVPDVVGQPRADAIKAIQAAGFNVKTNPDKTPSDATNQDTVFSQDPIGGNKVASGTTISITVWAPLP